MLAGAKLVHAGRIDEAEAIGREALRAPGAEPNACQLLGLCEIMRGRPDEAITWYQRGLRSSPRHPILLCALGKAATTLGRYPEAISRFEQALSADPASVLAAAGLAEALERLGRAKEGLELLAKHDERDPEIALMRAVLLNRVGKHEEVPALLEGLARDPAVHPVTRRKMLFALGEALDRANACDGAFDAWSEANALQRHPLDFAAVQKAFAELREMFGPAKQQVRPRGDEESERPVFIVGMPRSGSTLIEQILDAHPMVRGVGEIDEIRSRATELAQETGQRWPALIDRVTQAQMSRASARHLGVLAKLGGGAARVVDKNLLNFRLVGLIALLFPRARVIWSRRDPLATCLSCFSLPLSSVALPFTSDIQICARFHLEVDALMEFWMQSQTIAILPVQYESLVAETEAQARRIVDFLGLPWDAACLRFHESTRPVATSSYHQVRMPVHLGAVSRHLRYAAQLAEAKAILEGSGAKS